jgi:predicted TIM-barrel fold metal-dependent hydrolase
LQCSLTELGPDSVMFSVDWPWATNLEGIRFIEEFPADVSVKNKILHQNVERLLRL